MVLSLEDRMKLNRLPNRLASVVTTRLPVLDVKAGSTRRISGSTWMQTRRRILQRDGFACQCCGVVRMDNEIDHRVPLEQGGSNEDSNLQTLCGGPDGCHTRKSKAEAKDRAGQR
jgi:5-methylcytosine-specific restriction endonuclease McrA